LIRIGKQPLFRLKRKVLPGSEVELFYDNDLLQFRQGTLKLEQKVAGYFEQWRDLVYRYVVAAFGNSAQAEDVTSDKKPAIHHAA
jgi:hypothetical protein